jgi:tetratricopeptide (TPR) repeat protein
MKTTGKTGIFIGMALLILGVIEGVAQTDYAKLEAAFSKSYTLDDNNDRSGAIKALKEVYQENSYALNVRLGWLTYQEGNFTESSAYYNKAIQLQPYSIEAKFGLTYPESALGNWDQVLKLYQEILEIDAMNSSANYHLGLIYYNRKDYANAAKVLEKVVNLWPFDYDGMVLYAWTEYQLGKYREAKVLFNKVLLIRPGDTSAEEGLALIK